MVIQPHNHIWAWKAQKNKHTPRPGIEPGASAWQAEMLPTTPTRICYLSKNPVRFSYFEHPFWRSEAYQADPSLIPRSYYNGYHTSHLTLLGPISTAVSPDQCYWYWLHHCWAHLGFAVELLTHGHFALVLLPVSRTSSVSAHVAQLGERLTDYVKVLGSIPSVWRVLLW